MSNTIKIISTNIACIASERIGIMAYDKDGREYLLMNQDGGCVTFPRHTDACRFAKKVADKGEINLDLWSCRTPYGSSAWWIDGMEERQIEDERFGYFLI